MTQPRQPGARVKPAEIGVHVVTVEATRGAERIGVATRHLLTGGADLEMADPRANEAVLARMANDTAGALVREADVDRPGMMAAAADPTSLRATRELWHGPVPILIIIGLLSAEWVLRRRWGLR